MLINDIALLFQEIVLNNYTMEVCVMIKSKKVFSVAGVLLCLLLAFTTSSTVFAATADISSDTRDTRM